MHQLGKLTKNFVVLDSCNDNKRLSILFYLHAGQVKTWWQISFLAPSQPQTLLYHHTMKNQLSSKHSMHHCSQ